MKKHVLFFSYYFPPQRAIAAVRTGAIARALVEAGWKVTVVTISRKLLLYDDGPQLDSDASLGNGITVIGTEHSWRNLVPGLGQAAPNKGLNWFVGGIFRQLVSFLSVDREIGWRKHALAAAYNFKCGEVDLVLSSGSPWISHEIAAQIAHRLNCPYVLDYRDLWSGNPHAPVKWRYIRNKERDLYHGAAAVITIAPSMQRFQRKLFGHNENSTVISNAYDSHEYENIPSFAFQDFVLVYAGRFIPPIGTADPLFMVVRQLMECQAAIPWSFHYYGHSTSHVQKAALRYGVGNKVHIHGPRPRQEALSAVKGAGVALVVTSVAKTASASEAGILTGKVFEAIGLGVPFLVVAPQNADIRKVVDTVGGGRVFCADEIDSMVEYVCQLMEGNCIPYRTPQEYSWEHLGKKISDILSGSVTKSTS